MTGLELLQRLALESELLHGEPKCESPHEHSLCSGPVTHKAFGCIPPMLLCHNAYAASKWATYHDIICRDCNRPASDCWRFIPI